MDIEGDTEYFASTDYNQRREQKLEQEFENKQSSVVQEELITDVANNLTEFIKTNNLIELYKIAAKKLSLSDYQKILEIGDKDLHIQLARNPNINDEVAKNLIGTVYLAHKELLDNPNVSTQIKNQLIDYLKTKPNSYKELLQAYSQ